MSILRSKYRRSTVVGCKTGKYLCNSTLEVTWFQKLCHSWQGFLVPPGMYFKPFTVAIDGKEAQVVHLVGTMVKINYDGKEHILTLDFENGKAKWLDKGNPVVGAVKKLTQAIEDHLKG